MAPLAPSPKSVCPLCDRDNRCSVATGGDIDDCWCRAAAATASLAHTLQNSGLPARCLCQQCLVQEQEQQKRELGSAR